MAKISNSPLAETDRFEIWDYIAKENLAAADRLIEQIDERCQKLLRYPEVGLRRDELGGGIRSTSVGNYLIFYRASGEDIEIVRVLHSARDVEPLFNE